MHKIWGESVPNLRGEFWRNKQKTQNVVIMYPGQIQNIVPSVDKGKHACQCAFAALLPFSPWRAPARLRLKSQKSLGNPSLAGAKQFCRAEMCPDKERPARNTCRISNGLDAVWAYFCPSKPCLPLSTDGMKEAKQKKSTAIGGRAIYIAEGIRWKKARKKMGREGRECIDKRGICDKIRKNAERK